MQIPPDKRQANTEANDFWHILGFPRVVVGMFCEILLQNHKNQEFKNKSLFCGSSRVRPPKVDQEIGLKCKYDDHWDD